ncbi:hypothetical protein K450DRAFT_239434 [Umbelopsis ramanniana AG]|uniref:Uncharacterized protein n=1 Tax=Umbelopsis ramanniana AG TaxID=1314678 RepID=A0AAD5ED70_UMBRA|nr:uncharacterized protein K450DRAFT_239434 [Umbelopsis ramanniana AG]KAI8580105.1 hypothetical protein K450DRAFT_239434 [Umbelopsis ramanniana AG]
MNTKRPIASESDELHRSVTPIWNPYLGTRICKVIIARSTWGSKRLMTENWIEVVFSQTLTEDLACKHDIKLNSSPWRIFPKKKKKVMIELCFFSFFHLRDFEPKTHIFNRSHMKSCSWMPFEVHRHSSDKNNLFFFFSPSSHWIGSHRNLRVIVISF